MKVGLNHPIKREVIEKMMEFTESDGLTQSVTEESAEESPIMRDEPIKRARKGLRKYKSLVRKLKNRVNDKVTNPKIAKSKAATVVKPLAKVSLPNEVGQVDSVTHGGREKESQAPPMEMEVISQCGSGVLEDYKPSRTNLAEIKLEGQLDVVGYSRITVPESVHMGDPAGGCMEMVKARNSARGHLMA